MDRKDRQGTRIRVEGRWVERLAACPTGSAPRVSAVISGFLLLTERDSLLTHVHIGGFVFFNLFEGVSNEAGIDVVHSQRSRLGQVAPGERVVVGRQEGIATLEAVEER